MEILQKYLHQYEIRKLENKALQLRYILGGLNTEEKEVCGWNSFWRCDISCSCLPVPEDERLLKIHQFISNHNISNETFLRLILTYLNGHFNSFKGDFGSLIPELYRAITDYHFVTSTYGSIIENDLKEKKLLKLVDKYSTTENSPLFAFLKTYSLNSTDFIILAKTSLNYNYAIGRGFEIKDLPVDLVNLLKLYNLKKSKKFVEKYREKFEKKILVKELKNEDKPKHF